jgi:hypothetical protein
VSRLSDNINAREDEEFALAILIEKKKENTLWV